MTKHKLSMLFLAANLSAMYSVHATEDIENYQSKYTSSDILAAFGQQRTYNDPSPYRGSWGIDAQLNTNIECGKIQFATNIDSTIKKLKNLPNKIIDYVHGSFPALIDALPILALCTTDPVLCAELKNLNLKLDMDIGLQTNSCYAINKYINNQADKGRMEAYNKALQACVSERSGGDPKNFLAAMNSCQDGQDAIKPNNVLVADIINRKMNVTLTQAQDIIKSVLTSTGRFVTQNDHDRYSLLNAAIGETKLQVNGASIPILPENDIIISPNDVVQFLLAKSTQVSCDPSALYKSVNSLQQADSSDPSTRYLENIVYKSIKNSLVNDDVYNLDDVSKANKNIICSFLGRSLALKSLDYFISEISDAMNSVQNNDYIPDEIRKKYSDKSADFFVSLKSQMQPEEIYPINVVRMQIAKMAKMERMGNRALSASVTKEYIKNNAMIQLSDSCDSVYTCN